MKHFQTSLACLFTDVFELLHHDGVHYADSISADDECQAVHLVSQSWVLIVASVPRDQPTMRKLRNSNIKLKCSHDFPGKGFRHYELISPFNRRAHSLVSHFSCMVNLIWHPITIIILP